MGRRQSQHLSPPPVGKSDRGGSFGEEERSPISFLGKGSVAVLQLALDAQALGQKHRALHLRKAANDAK